MQNNDETELILTVEGSFATVITLELEADSLEFIENM